MYPEFSQPCPAQSVFHDDNREFHAHLKALKIPHEYEEFPRAHTWDYWDQHIQETIAFHQKALGIPQK